MQEQELKAIGTRIRSIREDLELKQEEFAAKLDVNKKTISLLENGHRRPSHEVLSILSRKYSANLDWINSGKGDKYSSKESNPKSADNLYAKVVSLEMEVAELKAMMTKILEQKR